MNILIFVKKNALFFLTSLLLLSCQTTETINTETPSWARQREMVTTASSHIPPSQQPVQPITNEFNIIPTGNPQNLTERINGDGRDLHNRNLAAQASTTKISPEFLATASGLEKLYLGHVQKNSLQELNQFGYDYLDSPSQPNANISVPPQYVIGSGDEILLNLSGSIEAVYKLYVDRDGAINIPDIGVLSVTGITMEKLPEHVRSFIEERRKGFTLNLSLGNLKTLQVKLTGNVKKPGITQVSPLSTPILALAQAGGIRKDGSLRKIILKRDDHNTVIDLYDYFFDTNKKSSFIQLQDGDQLFVPPIGKTIAVAGLVKQPAIFEINKQGISIKEAIALAGGLTPFSFTPLAHIERSVAGRGRERIDITLNENDLQETMSDGELLIIEAIDNRRQPIIQIEGEVTRPGQYAFSAGMKLSEAIKAADGVTINAFLEQIFISRQTGKTSTLYSAPNRSTYQQNRQVLIANLHAIYAGDSTQDITLQPLDHITVRPKHLAQTPLSVEIIGAVQYPGIYELTAGMRVSDLVAIAGNPTPNVYYDEAELIRKVFDEEDRRLNIQRFRINLHDSLTHSSNNSPHNPILKNGDQLIIRTLQQSQVRVSITGRVRFPGDYIFPAGAKIDELVQAAGGIIDDADLRAAKFTRQSTKELQRNSIDDLTERVRQMYEKGFEDSVNQNRQAHSLANKLALEQTLDTLQRMKKSDVNGRIIIPFTMKNFPSSHFNLTLENGDALHIPQFHQTVSVVGHVFRPLSLVAHEGYSIKEAIKQAGGLTETGDKESIYIIRADGSVENVDTKRHLTRKHLLAGDVLLVPREPLERSLGASLSEAILLVRQAAEVALLSSQIGTTIDTSFVSPINYNPSNFAPETLEGTK